MTPCLEGRCSIQLSYGRKRGVRISDIDRGCHRVLLSKDGELIARVTFRESDGLIINPGAILWSKMEASK